MDILIRDVPDVVVTAMDTHAARLGISRTEYIRRRLAQDANISSVEVVVDDLRAFSARYSDLGDPDVMGAAWS